jgi:hypothetical protein
LFSHKLNSKASLRPSSMIIQTRNINQTIQNQSFTKDGQSKTLYKQQSTPLILHELSPLVLKYKKQLPPCTNRLKPSLKEHHHKQDLKPDWCQKGCPHRRAASGSTTQVGWRDRT